MTTKIKGQQGAITVTSLTAPDLSVNTLNPHSGALITVPTGYKLIGTDAGSIYAPGHVIAIHTIRSSTRTSIGSVPAGYILFNGSFTKQLASSNIIATCTVFGTAFQSGNSGVWLKLTDSTATDYWDYGVAYQYDGAWSATQQVTMVIGQSAWSSIPAGTTTVGFGWNPANGASGERPFSNFNPNSTDDVRNRQMASSIFVYEIAT